ncbi:GNAT family N-acetyltransferase [Billgrantia kenyensis]|uniref:GNAT family N-acetyltransferase n=1 Tax=Billgrantia kenyensis TaxID=321266 RepID=A0A7W0AG49_9GAMM|nr:GNAT family N-acetyltransferase [Halomonas kenyensis]MBA2781031.1 GNAT family N-acetyltransferase [Halomonas kenyensis]MCG6663744.1 GNAT family N-acetyltransferase [Halomonas kenyensis]
MQPRRLEEGDLEACATLFAQEFSAPPWSEPWTNERALARLEHFHASPGFVGMLALGDQGEVAGFLLGNLEPYVEGKLFYLREMCVATHRQGQGLGSELYRALERELATRDVRAVYLATGRGIPAARFYQQLGFRCSEGMAFYARGLKH